MVESDPIAFWLGLIAAAYPVYALTAISISTHYPALLAHIAMSATGIADELARVRRRPDRYLVLAAAVPLASLCAMSERADALALGELSAAGAIGFAIVFTLYGDIHRNLDEPTATADAQPSCVAAAAVCRVAQLAPHLATTTSRSSWRDTEHSARLATRSR